MLSSADYQEAVRRYKNMKLDGHERQRCHALILVQQEYSYREIAEILLVDDGTVSRWVEQYEAHGLTGLQNDRNWGGAHGQSELNEAQVTELKKLLREGAMPGTALESDRRTAPDSRRRTFETRREFVRCGAFGHGGGSRAVRH